MKVLLCLLWVPAMVSVAIGYSSQLPPSSEDKEMKAAVIKVEAGLKELNARQPTITPIADEAVLKALPDVRVVSVRFRQYPVAMLAPEPLKSQNLFFAAAKGQAK